MPINDRNCSRLTNDIRLARNIHLPFKENLFNLFIEIFNNISPLHPETINHETLKKMQRSPDFGRVDEFSGRIGAGHRPASSRGKNHRQQPGSPLPLP
ncbi:hypothetical protein ABH309_10570 [Chromobacterium piscinae]|uniref:Uncharacterized protein n=1 Tax=Chromobacterium piscinae TaxID=686831 RepID=A0ABV0H530_9NEIS|nr:hypothetical protein [Chromobacterium piscinae]MCD5326954.1 hypothetical protein [Chromobacterium piscinae]